MLDKISGQQRKVPREVRLRMGKEEAEQSMERTFCPDEGVCSEVGCTRPSIDQGYLQRRMYDADL